MYDAISKYKREFMLFHNFMEKDNPDTVPFVNTRQNGSIFIFISKIPFDYGRNKLNLMPRATFQHISEFVQVFWDMVQLDLLYCKGAMTLDRSFEKSGGDWQRGNDGDSRPASPAKTGYDKSAKPPYDGEKKRFNFTPRKSVNNLSEKFIEDNDDEIDDFDGLTFGDFAGYDDENEIDSAPPIRDTSDEYSHTQHDADDIHGMASPPSKSRDKRPGYTPVANKDSKQRDISKSGEKEKKALACFKMLMNGQCENEHCTYSHEQKVLEEAYATAIEKLKTTGSKWSGKAARGPGGQPMSSN
jgi:hypothetical protein